MKPEAKPMASNAGTKGEEHREGEEQPVHRAGAHLVVTLRQQKDQRGQPQRIQDPDEIPGRRQENQHPLVLRAGSITVFCRLF